MLLAVLWGLSTNCLLFCGSLLLRYSFSFLFFISLCVFLLFFLFPVRGFFVCGNIFVTVCLFPVACSLVAVGHVFLLPCRVIA